MGVHRVLLPLIVTLAGCGNATSTCVPGHSSLCACADGRAGSQPCNAHGTFDACSCMGTQVACTAGQATVCACSNGLTGSQTCNAKATYDACMCDKVATCVPGQSVACTCANGLAGAQTCRSNGTFALCSCASGPQPKRVFVTRTTYEMMFGPGSSGASALCAQAATAAALGGSGNWQSYLSGPRVYLLDVSPWYLVDGTTMVFPSKEALASGPAVAVNMDEYGGTVAADREVWTGTHADATGGLDCSSWISQSATGIIGRAAASDATWTEAATVSCAAPATRSLYCFEQ